MQEAARPSQIVGIDWPYLLNEWKSMFQPSTILNDIGAGLTVALVALPLNLALAIAAGVDPGIGITTGIVAGVVAGLMGGQRLAITGPAAAMAVVLVEIAHQHGIKGIWMVGLIAGALQILSGFLRLGKLISYIPMPVMVGFANGIGILVLFNAIDDFIGLTGKTVAHAGQVEQLAKAGVPEFFIDVGHVFVRGFIGQELNPVALGIGLLTLFVALLATKLTKRVPGALVAIVVATVVCSHFGLQIPTIATISSIPNFLPAPMLPQLPWEEIVVLFPAAITVFVLGSIESLLSASVADGMSMSPKHHANQELIGQGIANCVVPFFGGIPVTGVIARTAVNIRAGAKTRLSAMVHSITLMVLIFFLAKYAEQIPLSALAAVLILTGFRLIEGDAVREIWHGSRLEAWASLATTFASVCVDLTAGVLVGLVITCGLFVRQMSKVQLHEAGETSQAAIAIAKVPTCKYVKTYAVDGPLFFGAAERFIENIVFVDTVKAIILHMGAAKVIDMTGVQTLISIHKQLLRQGGKLVLSDVPSQPMQILERTGALDVIGRANVYREYRTAVLSVNNQLLASTCANCKLSSMKDPKVRKSGAISKLTDAVAKTTGNMKRLGAAATEVDPLITDRTNAPLDCPLRCALVEDGNPLIRQLEEVEIQARTAAPVIDNKEWLVGVQRSSDIPEVLKGSPIETLMFAQNMGQMDTEEYEEAALIIGMCIDYRKSLSIPKDFAYTIRREGANMRGAEFAIALGMSKNINYMALVAHNNCAMANTKDQREAFISTLVRKNRWPEERAAQFFDEQGRSRDIGNEIDFVIDEAKRITSLFPGLVVVPLVFRVENDRLYFIYDWLQESAPNDPVTVDHRDDLIGKNTIGVPKYFAQKED